MTRRPGRGPVGHVRMDDVDSPTAMADVEQVDEATDAGQEEKTAEDSSYPRNGDQSALEEAKQRREAARREVERQAEAAARGETLSKSARKRIIKLQQLDERKEKRKEDKKLRKQNRKERPFVPSSGAPSGEVAEELVSRKPLSEAEHAAASWALWRSLGSPRLVLAPMVNQSELAFRLLARKYGAQLCYTPMLHSTLFASEEYYRVDNFDPLPDEGPLVVQFCGDDPATILAAARLVERQCVAVDLNCGCPQGIAKCGHYVRCRAPPQAPAAAHAPCPTRLMEPRSLRRWSHARRLSPPPQGAFLLDEPNLIESIVRELASHLRCPSWVKMRVLPAADGARTRRHAQSSFQCRLHTSPPTAPHMRPASRHPRPASSALPSFRGVTGVPRV